MFGDSRLNGNLNQDLFLRVYRLHKYIILNWKIHKNYVKDISIFSTLMWRGANYSSSACLPDKCCNTLLNCCQQKKEVTQESKYNREDIDAFQHTYNLSPLKLQTKCFIFFPPLIHLDYFFPPVLSLPYCLYGRCSHSCSAHYLVFNLKHF